MKITSIQMRDETFDMIPSKFSTHLSKYLTLLYEIQLSEKIELSPIFKCALSERTVNND